MNKNKFQTIRNTKESAKPASISIGIVSLITILGVLLLTTFSVLIVSSARTDINLSEKTVAALEEYYIAENEAELKMLEISNIIENYKSNLQTELENNGYFVFQDNRDLIVSYYVKINDKKDLFVEISISDRFEITRLSQKPVVVEQTIIID